MAVATSPPPRSPSPADEKEAKDGAEFAYEYVPVVQRREGRANITYEMTMRQQPVQARMCGVGEKSDRRPVDPAPIIQLRVMDKNGEDVTKVNPSLRDEKEGIRRPEPGPNGMTFMQIECPPPRVRWSLTPDPYYFLFACLVGGEETDDELHVIDDGKTRFLTGTPVSSLYHLKDLDKSDAAFFVFPDLGVRKEGKYRLKLTLFEIVDQEVFYCTTTFTSVFSVYSAKKFPGMSQGASELSRSFADQGLKIRVRKEARKRTGKAKRKSTTESSEDDNRPKRLSRGPIGADPRYAFPYTQQPGYHMPPPPPPPGYDPHPRDPRDMRDPRGSRPTHPPSAYAPYARQQPPRHHGSLPPAHIMDQQQQHQHPPQGYGGPPPPQLPPQGYGYDRPSVPWPQSQQPRQPLPQDRDRERERGGRHRDRDDRPQMHLPPLSSLTSTSSGSGSGEQPRGGTSHSHSSTSGSGSRGGESPRPGSGRNHRMGLGHLVD